MNTFQVGNHLWVSRFSEHIFDDPFNTMDYINGEWISILKLSDIFQPPMQYIIVDIDKEFDDSKQYYRNDTLSFNQ